MKGVMYAILMLAVICFGLGAIFGSIGVIPGTRTGNPIVGGLVSASVLALLALSSGWMRGLFGGGSKRYALTTAVVGGGVGGYVATVTSLKIGGWLGFFAGGLAGGFIAGSLALFFAVKLGKRVSRKNDSNKPKDDSGTK